VTELYNCHVLQRTKVAASRHLPASVLSKPRPWDPSQDSWLLFQRRVETYTAKYQALWETVAAKTPCPGPAISPSDKVKREAQATRQMQEIKGRLQHYPPSPQKREPWRDALLDAARAMARTSLGLPDAGLELFFTRAGVEATRQFVCEAKAFDPNIDDASLLQALRNLWVIHCIQLLLEKEMSLSPAILGYSLLYPWTDNYLDDTRVPGRSKLEFGDWLEERLRGFLITPRSSHAAQVGRLVSLIETCFPRGDFEAVYLSLRAIHRAQMASLEQQQPWRPLDPRELLRTTIRKGGTSVLADAYLVAGQLGEREADFMFGYGVLLQLMDDLQDVQNDLANGHATLFAWQAGARLDAVTAKFWSFAQAVLWSSGCFQMPKFHPIKALIEESCKLLVLQAVARNHGCYSSSFTTELETCSPFSFTFLRNQETSFGQECKKIAGLLKRRQRIDSAFDVLA